MLNSQVCPICGEGHLQEHSYSETLKSGRRLIEVTGLRKSVCDFCETALVLEDQQCDNLKATEAAVLGSQAGVTVGLLRQLRERWRLSQKDASLIFGAGSSAFAKWESGQSRLSTPAALLVQCAFVIPAVVPYLAKLAGLRVDPPKFHVATAPNFCADLEDGWHDTQAANLAMFRSDGKGTSANENGPLRSHPRWLPARIAANAEIGSCYPDRTAA